MNPWNSAMYFRRNSSGTLQESTVVFRHDEQHSTDSGNRVFECDPDRRIVDEHTPIDCLGDASRPRSQSAARR